MRSPQLFRFATALIAVGLVLGPAAPPVQAQDAGAPESGPEVTPNAQAGRLAWAQGNVSFHTAEQDSWSPAVVNYPVTPGDAVWTQPDAQAGLEFGGGLVALNGGTEVDVASLDDTSIALTEPQGETYLHIRALLPGESYTMQTPRGTVTIAQPGRYEIAAGTTQDPTLVTVLEGAAQVSGAASADVGPGQTAVITGDQTFQAQITPAARDGFLDAMLAREQPRRPAPSAVPAVVQQMPGGADLAEYGNWAQSPDYGQVWYPQVQSGWEPYRDGHWAYVQPWGWTWVDDEPWGFAPFHYGRWVFIGGRWAWVPANVAVAEAPAPVYAPALVAFFGLGIGVGVAASGLFGGHVCWVPLGPGEPYRPWFRASPAYFRQVNIRHVTNITNITTVNNVTINNFRNSRAALVMPAGAMATSRPVHAVAQRLQPGQFREARPFVGRQPIPPTTATMGVTPAVARQVHAVPPPAGFRAPPRATAPGPEIRPREGARPTPVTLRPPGAGAPHPGTTAPATAAVVHPGAPALRAPGRPEAPPPIVHEPGVQASVRPTAPGAEPTRQPQAHAALPLAQPGATQPPHVTTQPTTQPTAQPTGQPHAPGAPEPPHVATVPPPAVHVPTPHVAETPHRATAAPQMHLAQPAPQAHVAAPPLPQVHAAAPPPPQVHVPAPPPPQVHAAAPPPPQVHAPPPPPQMHAAAPPPPQVHAPPPPPPQMHAAAAPPPQHSSPQQHQKRPGEP